MMKELKLITQKMNTTKLKIKVLAFKKEWTTYGKFCKLLMRK